MAGRRSAYSLIYIYLGWKTPLIDCTDSLANTINLKSIFIPYRKILIIQTKSTSDSDNEHIHFIYYTWSGDTGILYTQTQQSETTIETQKFCRINLNEKLTVEAADWWSAKPMNGTDEKCGEKKNKIISREKKQQVNSQCVQMLHIRTSTTVAATTELLVAIFWTNWIW